MVQLLESIGNVNHAISIVGYWIFDSNYKKALFLTQESLDLICSTSIGEKQVVTFWLVFILLDTFGHQFIFKKDKYETIK